MTRADQLQEAESLLRTARAAIHAYSPYNLAIEEIDAFLSRSESAPAAPAPGIALPEWRYDPKHSMLYSSNFTHDAALHLTGDFADDAQRTAYASQIVAALNALNASGGSASTRDEHIVAALEVAADRSALAIRERCARVCEVHAEEIKEECERSYTNNDGTARDLASAIRALPLHNNAHNDGEGEG